MEAAPTGTTSASGLRHLTPDTYNIIGPEDFGAPGLVARESVGPGGPAKEVGTIFVVHDSTFEPNTGIGHHPHQRMERLFYILEGAVDHDDVLNGITGHMGTGDLGILTEGRRGMIHSEWNNTDGRARAYIFVYPTEPLPPTASFDAIRDHEATRSRPAAGVETKTVVARGSERITGDFRVLADSSLEEGAELEVALSAQESSLVFVVEGSVEVRTDAETVGKAGEEDTVIAAAQPGPHVLRVEAKADSRVLHAIAGPGRGGSRP